MYFPCILQLISPCHLHSFEESLHGCFPETVFPGVRPLRVIGVHPSVKVCLQLFYRGVYLLSESDGVEFVLDSPVEAFTDAVCLRALGLDLGMVYVLDGQIQFVFMCFPVSAVFGSPVREHPHQFQVMLLEERNHPVIEHVRRHERVLPVVKFGESDFGIGVDDRLLVNVPHAFDIPYIIGVLRHKEALQEEEAWELSVRQAQENYRIMQNRYMNQLAILTDLLDANSVLLNAELQLTSSRTRIIYTYYQLQKACGRL